MTLRAGYIGCKDSFNQFIRSSYAFNIFNSSFQEKDCLIGSYNYKVVKTYKDVPPSGEIKK